MSHEIDSSTGTNAMAFVGSEGKPWHGLGQPIEKGASIKEIQQAAQLGWKVLRKPLSFAHGKQEIELTERFGLVRDDTLAVLDVCGKEYTPHQNDEVLEFFAEYVEAGDMFIDTAGALQGGKYVWVQAQMTDSFTLPGKDKVNARVLLMNPHLWGKGMVAKLVAERVVCWNTLTVALGEGGASVKIWHTAEFNKARRDAVKENLGIAKERFGAIKDDAKAMAATTITAEDAIPLFAKVFGGDTTKPREEQGRTVLRLMELWEGAGKGADMLSAKGTAWGMLNAVTQYIDHEYGRSVDSRVTNAWLSTGEKRKRDMQRELLTAIRAAA